MMDLSHKAILSRVVPDVGVICNDWQHCDGSISPVDFLRFLIF